MAALSLSNLSFGKAKKQFNSVKDRIYYGDILPPVGSQELSYARFMDFMHDKRVKRVIILADGKVAMVEVPVEGYASKLEEARFNARTRSELQPHQFHRNTQHRHCAVSLPMLWYEQAVV